MTTRLFILPAFILMLCIPLGANADCAGCCVDHGGAVCSNYGFTRCKDGTELSRNCFRKGCDACGNRAVPKAKKAEAPPAKVKPVRKKRPLPKFRPEDWPHWKRNKGACRNMRTHILLRDNTGRIRWKGKKACNVKEGRWVCPYSGKVYYKAADVAVDHIVPLAHAHRTGGARWSYRQKRDFANDPLNLIVVEKGIKAVKGDQGPDAWKPLKRGYWKKYAKKWRAVKQKYRLKISDEEAYALKSMER